MFWLAIAAAAQLGAADAARDIRTLFSYDDVPNELVPEGQARTVGVRVTVRPNGQIQNCDAEFSSGIPKLDAYTCSIIQRRARFEPRLSPDGQPIFRVVRANVSWSVNALPSLNAGDIKLYVSWLPKGARNLAGINMNLLVDEKGHPASCIGEEPPLQGTPKTPAQLVQIACNQLIGNYVAIPARDDGGNAVRSLQNAFVSFFVNKTK